MRRHTTVKKKDTKKSGKKGTEEATSADRDNDLLLSLIKSAVQDGQSKLAQDIQGLHDQFSLLDSRIDQRIQEATQPAAANVNDTEQATSTANPNASEVESLEEQATENTGGATIETLGPESNPAELLDGMPIKREQPQEHGMTGPMTAHNFLLAREFDISCIEEIGKDTDFVALKNWIRKWRNNAKRKSLDKYPRRDQVYSLLTAMGGHAANVLEVKYRLDMEDSATTVELMLQCLEKYYRSKRNIAVDEVAFCQRKQAPHESFDSFWFALSELADNADICQHCKDHQIVRQIIVGIEDNGTRQRLLREKPFPSLERAINICQARENVDIDDKLFVKSPEVDINKVQSQWKKQKSFELNKRPSNTAGIDSQKCSYCGQDVHNRKVCPAKNASCRRCG